MTADGPISADIEGNSAHRGLLRMGELAEASGVPAPTIKHYLREAGYSDDEIAAMVESGAAAGPSADSASTFRA